ncbi:A24 family peptidase C-terminal domain-containing protein [Natrononativus amylolyticus]|uniref:A24 family peptidase C-terminal domain-containing protein n=1 Tax=Natrononativus amylolyticus TaxID=2963434 RepID=UPI0020CEF9AD|nr:A24 family peptidase C-terminal domain-containing protein [Natrononativus amylolyticus]
MTLSTGLASTPDLLRLLAVPVFAWAAVRDVRTRRIAADVWVPLGLLALVLLVWDGWLAAQAGGYAWSYGFVMPAAISLGFVVPLAYLFWWFGGFGGADAKALMVLALLFPTVPRYVVGDATAPLTVHPLGEAGAFSLTILTNAVLVGAAIPLALAIRNALAGRIAPVMFVGWPVSWERLPRTHGRLLETPTGLSRNGLDLDAMRMYLRWRGLSLADLRADPGRYRDPETLPAEPNPPTDGAVDANAPRSDGGALESPPASAAVRGDPWGAEAFLESIDGTAYGTTPETLRGGLEVAASEETVWVSPGTPFLVPVFLGLVIALLYGDLLFGLLF